MIPYASRTNMASAVKAWTEAGWRMLIEPSHYAFPQGRTAPPLAYMIDNGAWGCFKRGVEWDAAGFRRMVAEYGEGADMIVLPDIVEGGAESLARSLEWVPELAPVGTRLLLAVQDGMDATEVLELCAERGLGIFVGGSTEWKLETIPTWGRVSRQIGCWLHVARVNSVKRIRFIAGHSADSFDGTSTTLWPSTLRRLDLEVRQQTMFGARGRTGLDDARYEAACDAALGGGRTE